MLLIKVGRWKSKKAAIMGDWPLTGFGPAQGSLTARFL
jgi:hypothetical protein